MKQNVYRGEWAGCSDLTERRKELLKAHEEFQKMLNDGYTISKVTKPKRQRIKKDNFKIVMVFGKPMKLTIQEYNSHWLIAFGK
jgi:hypothetical protein